MRGQAFIVYRTPKIALHALTNLQNFPLFGKKIEVQFARSVSNATKRVLNKEYESGLEKRKRDQKKLEKAELITEK